MHRLTCYQQKRQNGGRRLAITVDDATTFHKFEPGDEDADPALEWYVDVRCQGPQLPIDPEKVRRWFLDQALRIKQGLTNLAEKLMAGMGVNSWPVEYRIPSTGRLLKMAIVCSALYRFACLEIASVLIAIRDDWETTVRSLPLVSEGAGTYHCHSAGIRSHRL